MAILTQPPTTDETLRNNADYLYHNKHLEAVSLKSTRAATTSDTELGTKYRTRTLSSPQIRSP